MTMLLPLLLSALAVAPAPAPVRADPRMPADVRVAPADVPVDVRAYPRVDGPVDVRKDLRLDGPVAVRVDVNACACACGRSEGAPEPADSPKAAAAHRPLSGPKRQVARRAPARIVVLDAGHGGRDSGMHGPSGVLEKDITLMLVRGLQDELERRGYEVHLTRDADTLIALADRPRRANDWKRGRPRAIFMSIHTNSGAPGSAGFETYFLSDARTADERRVAEMENAAADLEDRPVKSAPAVDWILESLRNDYYVRASNDLAELVQRHLGTVHPGPDRGVKQAGFRVLVGAIMPAVLVETAYMSNPKEEHLLVEDGFRRRMENALADAIDDFFRRHAWAAGEEH